MPEDEAQRGLAAMRALGSSNELRAEATEDGLTSMRLKTNTHVHLPPNFSAFDSAAQAVRLADEQDVRVLGASNYYDYRVYGEFMAEARRRGIFPLFGLEIVAREEELSARGVKINDPDNPGRMYICGKGITAFAEVPPRAKELLGAMCRNDETRMTMVITKLAELFGGVGVETGLDYRAVVDMVVRRHACPRDTVTLQERHVAMAFQEALFELVPESGRSEKLSEILSARSNSASDDAVAVQGEIRFHLMKAGKPAFVPESFLSAEQACELVLELGGIPCYPTLADGAGTLCEFESSPGRLVDELRDRAFHMAEYIPIRNSPEVLSEYVTTMRDAGIVVVAGTEHNTLELSGLEPECALGQPVPDAVKDIFWEGACVIAAHQFLVLHGECGFVDARGRPSGDCSDAAQRIRTFARLGAAVMRRYFDLRSE